VSVARVESSRRDAAFALCLAAVLAFGVLGVLLLNTEMQQQSHRISVQHQRIQHLKETAQQLLTDLDVAADPGRLAQQAAQLRMRPARDVRFVQGDRISGPRRAASTSHGG
jgi:type II secretory pathway component PulJ